MNIYQKILAYLKKGKPLTSLQAANYGWTVSLPKIISDLRLKKKIKIKKTWITNNGKNFIKYHL